MLITRRLLLIQVLLKARKDSPDLLRPAQLGYGVGDGVVVFEAEQRRQLFLVELHRTWRASVTCPQHNPGRVHLWAMVLSVNK